MRLAHCTLARIELRFSGLRFSGLSLAGLSLAGVAPAVMILDSFMFPMHMVFSARCRMEVEWERLQLPPR
jgi:hypothetical protein